ncbi:IS30 family transposase [Virgisporangium ochraceum]|uniref:IS30 family transposase n=1 Tax=Virgisporangium ochraceum TaxID=65505 RepID=A0A8J4EIC0_9ACTN|nr:IS30 family transposase [Virgisporangium ochraceum]
MVAGRLSLAEREEIGLGLARGESCRRIGARLGRAHTTVSREVERHSFHGHAVAFGRPEMVYRATSAHRSAATAAVRPRRAKLAVRGRLRSLVLRLLRRRWSPQQIAARLRDDFPDRPEMWVSHETIYQAIYLQSRGNLRAELTRQKALRSGRVTRRRRAAEAGAVRSNRPWLGLNISARPAEAADRAVPGHWEGDLVIGKDGASAVATLVERSTRFALLVGLPGGRVSEDVVACLAAAMGTLPRQLRRSLTWDQGSEMARHTDFSLATDCPVYFCDPHSPWQRGSNENTNGLLRQYYPKGVTDFRRITQHQLDTVAAELNSRPRQTLAWKTPAEKLDQLLKVDGATTD